MNRQPKRPTSVRFTEEMKGHVSFGEEDHERGAREGRETGTRLMFHLTIEAEDLDRFAADEARGASDPRRPPVVPAQNRDRPRPGRDGQVT